jgi:hypothetical protein
MKVTDVEFLHGPRCHVGILEVDEGTEPLVENSYAVYLPVSFKEVQQVFLSQLSGHVPHPERHTRGPGGGREAEQGRDITYVHRHHVTHTCPHQIRKSKMYVFLFGAMTPDPYWVNKIG